MPKEAPSAENCPPSSTFISKHIYVKCCSWLEKADLTAGEEETPEERGAQANGDSTDHTETEDDLEISEAAGLTSESSSHPGVLGITGISMSTC